MAWNMIAGGIAQGAGDAMKTAAAYYGTKQKNRKLAGVADSFKPYEGYRPPRIDFSDPTGEYGSYASQYYPEALRGLVKANGQVNTFRPTQMLYTGMVANRAQGNDVGYDPARQEAQQALIRSELNKRSEDEIRDARGSLSAAGLSGNASARSATEGRIQRDIGRTYGDALNQIAIESLARANQERDMNTARLGSLNESNFNQENTAADFDRMVWEQEQQNEANRRNLQLGYADRWQDPVAVGLAVKGANTSSWGDSMMSMGMGQKSGQGISPEVMGSSSSSSSYPNLNYGGGGYRSYASLARRSLVR